MKIFQRGNLIFLTFLDIFLVGLKDKAASCANKNTLNQNFALNFSNKKQEFLEKGSPTARTLIYVHIFPKILLPLPHSAKLNQNQATKKQP